MQIVEIVAITENNHFQCKDETN